MSRLSVAFIVSAIIALALIASPAQAQLEEINAIQQQPQSQGFIDRIMREYVYPIGEYDWRGMVRRFLNGVMDYLAPDAKQPKVGRPYYPADFEDPESDTARAFGRMFASQLREALQQNSLTSIKQDGENPRVFNYNSQIPANTAAHSWTYLGFLVSYCIISILGAVIPVYAYSGLAEDEIPPEPMMMPESMMMPEMSFQSEASGENGGFQPNSNFQNGGFQPNNNFQNGGFQPNNNFQNGGFQPNTDFQNGNFQMNGNFLGNENFQRDSDIPISDESLSASSNFRVNGIPQ